MRLREAFAGLGEAAAPGPDCPQPDRLWSVATGEAVLAERHEIIAHTASCASCAAAFRLALGLSRESSESAAVIRPDRRRWLRWRSWAAALAAAVLLAIFLPDLWLDRPSPYRGGVGEEIRSLLEEPALLARDHAELRWTEGPPGSTYELRVLTREGIEVTVDPGLTETRYRIPPAVFAEAPAGTVYYWQVKVVRPDGGSVISKTFELRLR